MDQAPPAFAQRLILIGGSVRAAAADAVAGGYRVIAIDRFADRDLQALCERLYRWQQPEDWLRLIARWPSAAVVPIGGFTWCPSGPCAPERLIAFPSPDTVAAMADPQQLCQVAKRSGIGFPRTIMDQRMWRDQQQPMGEPPGEPTRWLIKPRLGAGGIGIRRWQSAATADLRRAAPQQDEYLQQWVAGRPLGVSYFARRRDGRRVTRLLGACDGLTFRKHRDWPWLYGGSLGPYPLPVGCQEVLLRIGQQVATAFSLVGLFNVDFIRRSDGSLVLLEINPRYSASMELLPLHSPHRSEERASGPTSPEPVSLVDWHLAAYQEDVGQIDTAAADERTGWLGCGARLQLDHALGPATGRPVLACKRIIYATAAMRVEQSAAELLAMVSPHKSLEVSFHDLPPYGETIPAGCPALTVIVRGGSDAKRVSRWSSRIAAELRRRLGCA